MTLTKQKLVKLIKLSVESLGYTEVKDKYTGAQGLFIKKINDDLFLSLGTTISRYEKTKFTASFYLSKTTRWGSVWGDIPRESYKRIGFFLTKEERINYLNQEDFKGNDAWWDAFEDQELYKFLKVLKLTETRFINQDSLIENIQNSSEIDELYKLSKATIEKVNSIKKEEKSLANFNKKKDSVPIIWFQSAEVVLKEEKKSINKNLIELLAADSWRQNLFEKKVNP